MNQPNSITNRLTPVLMARLPQLGTAKTRLQADGTITPESVTLVASALLRTVAQRLLMTCGQLVIAGTPDDAEHQFRNGPLLGLNSDLIRFVPQKSGDLGERIINIWKTLGNDQPLAFFGMDSPDMPAEALTDMQNAVDLGHIAIGPTHDGGYWALAAPQLHQTLFKQIDWGTDRVYHQTCQKSRDAGLPITTLTTWSDVDHPSDLEALRQRLRQAERHPDPSLDELSARLNEILGP